MRGRLAERQSRNHRQRARRQNHPLLRRLHRQRYHNFFHPNPQKGSSEPQRRSEGLCA
uniref:Uncharacterized protein n=1 Tax=Arcella intermedia TaxID=1963864 RepID=A0A6B2LRX1_9EUKA